MSRGIIGRTTFSVRFDSIAYSLPYLVLVALEVVSRYHCFVQYQDRPPTLLFSFCCWLLSPLRLAVGCKLFLYQQPWFSNHHPCLSVLSSSDCWHDRSQGVEMLYLWPKTVRRPALLLEISVLFIDERVVRLSLVLLVLGVLSQTYRRT